MQVRVWLKSCSTQLPPCMGPCFDNALALVLYLTLKRSLQMVANHSASNGMKEPCINNNRVEIYFHNNKFLCDILMWHICKSYWSWHYHKPHQVFHTQKCTKNLQNQAFQELWKIWSTLLIIYFCPKFSTIINFWSCWIYNEFTNSILLPLSKFHFTYLTLTRAIQ
jgi:hypothetical protein